MLVFQYVWKYIISVIGTSRLSLIHAQFKSPNSYEIAFDKYRESLSCPHPPMHDNIMYQRSHRLAIWRYEKWPYRLTLPHIHTHRILAKSLHRLSFLSIIPVWFLCTWPWTVSCNSDCSLPASTSDCFTWTVFASRLPWSSTWYSTLPLSNPCCSALPVFDPILCDYS